ncbi:hypothetical protein LguiA_021405 [Lonicera macranthoides]
MKYYVYAHIEFNAIQIGKKWRPRGTRWATLGKGINRGIATFVAGALGVGAHRLASFSGEKFEPIILGLSVFFLVSGYRDDEVLDMALKRLTTILIGGSTAISICIFICPVWAGNDLHNLVASNMDKLGSFLEGFGDEYFTKSYEKSKDMRAKYESVLHSKSSEESLANFAKWEPRHGRFRYRHPWEQYLKIGALNRQCACIFEALNGYLGSEIVTSHEIRVKIQHTCTKMSLESSYALKELALSIRTMTRSSTAVAHIMNAKVASTNLNYFLKMDSQKDITNLFEVIPIATVASLCLDIVTCVENIAESVNELAKLANFKNIVDATKTSEKVRPCDREIEASHHDISVE